MTIRSACRLALAALALSAAAAAGAADPVEIPPPPMNRDRAAPPAILEDRARPPDAPTAAAIDAALRENDPAAARVLAEKALAASRIAYGPRDSRIVVPLYNLGAVKQRAGQVVPSLADFQQAIDLAENLGGPRDDRLFEAWYGTGIAQLEAGQFGPAVDSLTTALQLHRVNRGLYSDGQGDVLHALALATAAATGKLDDAFELERKRMLNAERLHAGKPEIVPLYDSVARWYRNNGLYNEAIVLNAFIVDLLTKIWSKDDPRLFPYLLELARSAGYRKSAPDTAPLAGWQQPAVLIERARVLASDEKFGTVERRARAMLEVGDTCMVAARRDKAPPIYLAAAQLFASAGLVSPLLDPAFLTLDAPGYVPGRAIQPDDGVIVAEFNVEANGKAQQVKIVEMRPTTLPKSTADALVTAIRRAQLRPRYQGDKPVAAQGIRFRLPVRGDSA